MTDELLLRAKWTLRVGDRVLVVSKRPNEKSTHVLMKAFLWALYLPDYPGLTVEVRVGDRYKPDVVALDERGVPSFWGESGQVGLRKLRSLFRRYPSTHFAVAKWDRALGAHTRLIEDALDGRARQARVDLLLFDDSSVERFVDDRGELSLTFDDVTWKRFGGSSSPR